MITMYESINVGVIGLGMGKVHAQAVKDAPKANLTWICDIDTAKLARVKEELQVPNACEDYRDMLKDETLDAVIIATPDDFHLPMTIDALKAGKHVMCEKPLALTRGELEDFVKIVHESDRTFMIGQICRFTPGFVEAKKRIDAGEIGELSFIESEYAHDYTKILETPGAWRMDPKRSGMVGGGCHAVDLLRWIAGNPEEITAYGVHKTFDGFTTIDDTHISIMKFPGGTIGKVFCSISCRRDYTMRSVFYGTKGTIITDNTSPTMTVFHYDAKTRTSIPETVELEIKNHNAYGEFMEFYDCIVNGKENTTTVEEGANTIAACLAIVESSLEGKSVRPKYF